MAILPLRSTSSLASRLYPGAAEALMTERLSQPGMVPVVAPELAAFEDHTGFLHRPMATPVTAIATTMRRSVAGMLTAPHRCRHHAAGRRCHSGSCAAVSFRAAQCRWNTYLLAVVAAL